MSPKTYHLLLGAALRAVLLVLAVKLVGVIAFANASGANMEVRTFLGFIPYFAVFADGLTFLNISTHSTLAMAVAAAGYLIRPAVQPSFPTPVTWGRLLGVVLTAETLLLQIMIEVLWQPNLRLDRVWWVIMALAAGVVLGSAGLGFSVRAEKADPPTAPRPSTQRRLEPATH